MFFIILLFLQIPLLFYSCLPNLNPLPTFQGPVQSGATLLIQIYLAYSPYAYLNVIKPVLPYHQMWGLLVPMA